MVSLRAWMGVLPVVALASVGCGDGAHVGPDPATKAATSMASSATARGVERATASASASSSATAQGEAAAPPSASNSAGPAPTSSARASSSAAPFESGGLGLQGVGPGGGCPCGCDHSEAMAAELRLLGGAPALARIESSIHTIGEREDAGYITEAMVRHRLRLLGLRGELEPGAERAYARPIGSPLPSGSPARAGQDTSVRAQLIVHGDTVEQVNGRQKPLKACFLLRMEIENTAPTGITVAAPRLEAGVPLPVSRWYLAGTAGEPWDGRLGRGEKKTVHVIGYTGQALAPGTDVDATIRFESLVLEANARARGHWNEPEPAR